MGKVMNIFGLLVFLTLTFLGLTVAAGVAWWKAATSGASLKLRLEFAWWFLLFGLVDVLMVLGLIQEGW